jgi:hypothetical protein
MNEQDIPSNLCSDRMLEGASPACPREILRRSYDSIVSVIPHRATGGRTRRSANMRKLTCRGDCHSVRSRSQGRSLGRLGTAPRAPGPAHWAPVAAAETALEGGNKAAARLHWGEDPQLRTAAATTKRAAMRQARHMAGSAADEGRESSPSSRWHARATRWCSMSEVGCC